MSATSPASRAPARGTDAVGVVLWVVAAVQFVPGVLAFVAPGAFYDLLAGYPPENHHFIRDLGTWQIALGLAAAVAAVRVSWRVPMLLILSVQFLLHAISHIIDVNDADPSWQGPFALVAELVVLAVLAGALVRETRR